MDTSDDRHAHEATGAATYSVPPVQRALALLRYVAAGNRCRNVSKAAKELGINRTTFIRLIATLQAERLVEEIDDGGGYRLGPGFLALAADALNARDVVQLARPVLAGLVRDLGLSAHFAVLDGREIVYLARQSPNAHLVSNVREGTRLPAHATTMGRILLAQLSPEELAARYSDADLASFTPKTATTVEALQTQLADDRALGIARSVANFELGIGSCACAVFDHLGQPAGAVNVSGPDAAFAPQNGRAGEIEAGLRAAADAISVSLGHRPDRVRAAAGLAQA